jgi:hypothetical protein
MATFELKNEIFFRLKRWIKSKQWKKREREREEMKDVENERDSEW